VIVRADVAVAVALAALVASGAPATAEPPFFATCGLARAFVAPTPSTAGSITIGERTVALSIDDFLPSTSPLGTRACLNRAFRTSGPVQSVIPMPDPLCGEIVSFPDLPTRLDVIAGPGLRVILLGATSLRDTFAHGATACLSVGLDAAGRAFALGVMGAVVPLPTPRPTTSASSLPSTATAGPSPVALVSITPLWLLAAALLLKVARRS
jgi:hypothetical protein